MTTDKKIQTLQSALENLLEGYEQLYLEQCRQRFLIDALCIILTESETIDESRLEEVFNEKRDAMVNTVASHRNTKAKEKKNSSQEIGDDFLDNYNGVIGEA